MNPLRKPRCCFSIFLLVATVALRSEADDSHAVMTDPGIVISNTAPADPFPSAAGFDFTVGSQSLLVLDLGMFDFNGDGFAVSQMISLYDMNSNQVASVTVPAGTSAALLNGFRYAPLTSGVTLAAGGKYILQALFFSDFSPGAPDRSYASASAATFDAEIIAGQERGGDITGSQQFTVVSTPFGPTPGPNALFTVVPEPSLFAVLMAGGLGLLGARRRDAAKPR
jgi:hypothetical protein